jgi:predicted amidohydrolase YtcJ
MAGDVTIFSADLRAVPADELTRQNAEMTIIAGNVVAERAVAAG